MRTLRSIQTPLSNAVIKKIRNIYNLFKKSFANQLFGRASSTKTKREFLTSHQAPRYSRIWLGCLVVFQ